MDRDAPRAASLLDVDQQRVDQVVIEDVVRRIQQIEIEIPILNRELLAGEDHKERITSLADEIEELKDKEGFIFKFSISISG